jgi:hypothetical protein
MLPRKAYAVCSFTDLPKTVAGETRRDLAVMRDDRTP